MKYALIVAAVVSEVEIIKQPSMNVYNHDDYDKSVHNNVKM